MRSHLHCTFIRHSDGAPCTLFKHHQELHQAFPWDYNTSFVQWVDDDPDEWYAQQVELLKERAPA